MCSLVVNALVFALFCPWFFLMFDTYRPTIVHCTDSYIQYFKSIEQVSDAQNEEAEEAPQAINLSGLDNSKAWKGLTKELRIDTDKKQVPQEDGELTPDSMSSRLVDSAIGMDDPKLADLKFDRMGSRVSTFAA
jgi:hypothetical protein